MNLELLNNIIEAKGIRKEVIAAALNISLGGLRLKLIGESEFKVSEAVLLSKVLDLNNGEILAIFFNFQLA